MRALAKALGFLGAALFLIGDKMLRAIWNVPFVTAEVIGIGGGVGLMLLAFGIQSASSGKEERSVESAREMEDAQS